MNPFRRDDSARYLYGDFNVGFVVWMRRLLVDDPRSGGPPGGVASWRFVRPSGRRRAIVQTGGCSDQEVEIPSLVGGRTFAPGQRVSVSITQSGAALLGEPPAGLVGASRFARSELSGDYAQPRITSSTPSFYPGESGAATFTGEQLATGDTLTAQIRTEYLADLAAAGWAIPAGVVYSGIEPQWLDDPWVTISGEANVDAESMTATVAVDSGSPYPRAVAVRVDRG